MESLFSFLECSYHFSCGNKSLIRGSFFAKTENLFIFIMKNHHKREPGSFSVVKIEKIPRNGIINQESTINQVKHKLYA